LGIYVSGVPDAPGTYWVRQMGALILALGFKPVELLSVKTV
jgi:hypothetical protein